MFLNLLNYWFQALSLWKIMNDFIWKLDTKNWRKFFISNIILWFIFCLIFNIYKIDWIAGQYYAKISILRNIWLVFHRTHYLYLKRPKNMVYCSRNYAVIIERAYRLNENIFTLFNRGECYSSITGVTILQLYHII